MISIGNHVHIVGPRLEEYEATVVATRGNVIDAEVPGRGVYRSLPYMPWLEPFTWHHVDDRMVPMEEIAPALVSRT